MTEPDSPGDLASKTPAGVAHPRAIRSFVRRAGRTTVGRAAPTVLEIGFGMGEATAHIAALMPETNFLCCEVHERGVGALLKRIGEQGLPNIRILQHDAVEVLAARLQPGGYLHCATDWEPYSQQMLDVLSAESQLHNSADGFAPKPHYRPLTKFEHRGLKLGHGVWDVVFRKA